MLRGRLKLSWKWYDEAHELSQARRNVLISGKCFLLRKERTQWAFSRVADIQALTGSLVQDQVEIGGRVALS